MENLEKIRSHLCNLYTDFLMLQDGDWIPDEQSIDASIEGLETVAAMLSIELTDTRN